MRNSKNSYSLTIMRWNCSRFEISFFSLLTIGKFLNYILNCWNVLKPDFSIRVKRFVKKEHFFWSSFQTNKIRSLKIEKTNQKRVFIPEEATLREVNDKQSCSIIVQRLFGSLSGNLNQTAGRLEWITDTRRPTVWNKKISSIFDTLEDFTTMNAKFHLFSINFGFRLSSLGRPIDKPFGNKPFLRAT